MTEERRIVTVLFADVTGATALGEALDPEDVRAFEETRAVPYAARVRCERALLTGNQSELEAGMHVLEALGDLDQLGRMERALAKGHCSS